MLNWQVGAVKITCVAAAIRRNDAQSMFRNTHRFSDPAPVHMRHLTGQVERQPAIGRQGLIGDAASIVVVVGLQKVSTQGRSSTSRDQALFGWRRTSR
jgi:hypothetical protein